MVFSLNKRCLIILLICTTVLYLSCSSHKPGSNITRDKEEFNVTSNNNSLQVPIPLIEIALNIDELEMYLHFEIPNRKPLVLLENKFVPSEELSIKSFGTDVILSRLPDKNGAHIEFIKMDKQNELYFVEFLYPVEGIKVSLEARNEDKWFLKSVKLVET